MAGGVICNALRDGDCFDAANPRRFKVGLRNRHHSMCYIVSRIVARTNNPGTSLCGPCKRIIHTSHRE